VPHFTASNGVSVDRPGATWFRIDAPGITDAELLWTPKRRRANRDDR